MAIPYTVNQHKVILTNVTFDPPQSIEFYGLLPDTIEESHSANFNPFQIMSRSGEIQAYAGGSGRTIELDIEVHEDYLAGYNGGKADIRDYAAQFKALTYPEYEGTRVRPPEVLLRVGSFINFHGICTSASVTWKKPIRNDRFIVAEFHLSLTETNRLAFAMSEILYKEDLRRV